MFAQFPFSLHIWALELLHSICEHNMGSLTLLIYVNQVFLCLSSCGQEILDLTTESIKGKLKFGILRILIIGRTDGLQIVDKAARTPHTTNVNYRKTKDSD